MHGFLSSLIKTGQPVLDPGADNVEDWITRSISSATSEASELLRELHTEQSLEFPGHPLTFDAKAAFFGLRTLFILCCATVFRQIDPLQIRSWLAAASHDVSSPEAHFSADLCLRHLFACRELVAQIADGDPLLPLIDQIAATVPLSSIGIEFDTPPDLSIIESHPGLVALHAERVIILKDFPRAQLPSVASQLQIMTGAHYKTLLPEFISLPHD